MDLKVINFSSKHWSWGAAILTLRLSSLSRARNCHSSPFYLQRSEGIMYMPGCSLVLTWYMKSTPPGVPASFFLLPSFCAFLHLSTHSIDPHAWRPIQFSDHTYPSFLFALNSFLNIISLVPTFCIKISHILKYKFIKQLLWSRHASRHFVYIKL